MASNTNVLFEVTVEIVYSDGQVAAQRRVKFGHSGVNPEVLDLLVQQVNYWKGRQKSLDRSRRSSNKAQYELSKRQQKQANRRKAKGVPEKTAPLPKGARKASKAGVPTTAYYKDMLSKGYKNNELG